MASSRKSPLESRLKRALISSLQPFAGQPVAIALSGGLDSVALLSVASQVAPSFGIALSAVHVNHNLSPNAANWAQFCAELCRGLGIPLSTHSVQLQRRGGESLEAVARQARYACYAQARVSAVVLAQHADDQAETVLQQLLRGGGVRGVAGMPASRVLPSGQHVLRPWLAVSRAQLVEYVAERQLVWVEDESNLDTRYDRNFIRHRVLPVVAESYPRAPAVLARSAQYFAEASAIADDLAQADFCGDLALAQLDVAPLLALPAYRAKNLLRWFLSHYLPALDGALLEEALRQIRESRPDVAMAVEMGEGALRRHAARIHFVRPVSLALPDVVIDWQGQDAITLPAWGGALQFVRQARGGIARARLEQTLHITRRRGGERIQPAGSAHHKTLKQIYQEQSVAPWLRERLPLIYAGDGLLAVPGLVWCHDARAAAGEPGYLLQWQFDL
ncbi:tRNA lysidine(34) synthetase TilS [Chitinivorax sp. PXF-14]|uniref:tRNA lysidine(34) synthetase TilS n=1 Tax=Chitinivorax sp. PXF-14 TaxID=3230488 RepID=UPI0034663C31